MGAPRNRSRPRSSHGGLAATAVALSLAAALSLPTVAAAQAPTATAQPQPSPAEDPRKTAARALADAGKERFDAGDYAGAIEALQDAEKYFPAPTMTRLRAMAHEKLGQLKRAQLLCEQAAGQALPSDAPDVFPRAQEDCKKLAADLDKRIPRVRISLLRAPAGTRVTVDGRELDAVALANRVRLDPGKHTIVAQAPGQPPIEREIDLAERAVQGVIFDLSPAAAEPSRVSVEEETEPTSRLLAPAIAFGIGGAGIVVGAVTGAMTLARAGEIRDLCGGGSVCPESQRAKVDLEGAKAVGYVSTAAFALAGVGAAVGVVLLLIPGDKKQTGSGPGERLGQPRYLPRRGEAPRPRLEATVGPAFIGVKGAF